ncbi:MAG: hypothetical protein JNM36_06450 [Chitinophagales bacterium]|jgi:hypothetical protein|nr:hypothetical protein [Chitinophagales bacterium]
MHFNFYPNFVQFETNAQYPHLLDCYLNHIDELKNYDQIECHVVLYPYSRQLSADNFHFNPYEEYVKDIALHDRSIYLKIGDSGKKLFGIALGLIILLVFLCLKPSEIGSIEAIVSIFGAYTIGKEVWSDLEKWLVNLTHEWKIRFTQLYYNFLLEKNTTLTNYSSFAKFQRYQTAHLLPTLMDYIEQSNSQTLRMAFDGEDIDSIATASRAHILSIHFEPQYLDAFQQKGFLLGVKLSCNRRKLWGLWEKTELFQSLHKGEKGCLDLQQQWIKNAVFYRHTYCWSRFKYFHSSQTLPNENLIDLQTPNSTPQ